MCVLRKITQNREKTNERERERKPDTKGAENIICEMKLTRKNACKIVRILMIKENKIKLDTHKRRSSTPTTHAQNTYRQTFLYPL